MKINFRNPKVLQIVLFSVAGLLMLAGIVLLVIAIHPPKKVVKTSPTKQAAIAIIQIQPTGFVPDSLKVTPGTKVVWVNKDQAPHQIAADPYPTHAELPALFAPKAMGYNETYSFVFTKSRTIHFHDELNPTWEGTIQVGK